MCFKRKKKEPINSLYQINQRVGFKNKKDEYTIGYIYDVRKTPDNQIIYDIQIGGECPIILKDIPENKIIHAK